MVAAVAALISTYFSAPFGVSAQADNVQSETQLKPGDVIVQKNNTGSWDVIKILLIDRVPGRGGIAHCLSYQDQKNKPDFSTARLAPIRILHVPILASNFVYWELLGNETVSREQLVGFIEYLKMADFPRYMTFTGQYSHTAIRRANEHYKLAYALGEKGKHGEAISEYSKAFELFPLFYEAIDNRAFTYMEIGNYEEALNDFEQSLRVNPDGVAAIFSKGECLMRLGELSAAEKIFSAGLEKFPLQREMFAIFLTQVRSMKNNE